MGFPAKIAGATNVRFAPDGGLLVLTDEALLRVDAKTGKHKKLMPVSYGGPLEVAGNRAFVGTDKKVLVVELKAKATVSAKLSCSGEGPSSIAVSPDQRFVLVVGSDEGGTLKCFELGKPRALYTIGSVRYAQTAWTPDGARFVTASVDWNARIKVHDAAKRGETLLDLGDPFPPHDPKEPGPSIHALVMAPTGEHVWFSSKQGIASLPLVTPAKATWLVEGRKVFDLLLAGNRLIGGSVGALVIVDIATRKVETIDVGGEVLEVALSPDGKKLAFVADDHVYVRSA